MSDTPRTDAAIIKDLHGNEVLYEGCRIARATEMALLERELAEARERCCQAINDYETAVLREHRMQEQRDMLAEALEAVLDLWQKCGGNQDDWAIEKAEEALSVVKG